MSHLLGFCAFAVGILVATVTDGTVLFVDQQSSAASDGNTGTEKQPFKTITGAAAKARAGDRVVIRRGEYRETVILTTSGTKEAPIIFEAAPGETSIIKGSDRLTDWTLESGAIWKTHLRDHSPLGPPGKPSARFDTHDVRQVFQRDGVLFEAQRLLRVTDRAAMKAGTFFCDRTTSLLYVWLWDSTSPVANPPEVSVRAAWLYVNADHIVIRGLQMRHASTTAIANWPACNLQGSDITMENCTVTWGDFVGVSMRGTGNRLRNCLIACNGDSGVGGSGEHHTIEGCRVVYNNTERYNPEWHAGGAKLIPTFRHGAVLHNEFAHNLGPGLWLDGSCDDNVIDGNLAHDNEGPGIMVEISSGNLVLNNICYANRNKLDGPYRDGKGATQEMALSEKRIAPLRLLKLYHSGDGRGIYISSAPATRVYYNTCYLNEAEGICVEGPPRPDPPGTMSTRDERVMNNISVFNKGSQLTLRPADPGQKPVSSDHNLLFAVGAVFAKYGWEGLGAISMPGWKEIAGQDTHSLDADPRFVMAAMDDFRVFPNSPALAAGTAIPEAGHDFFGHLRGKEKTTIGACEEPAQSFPQPAWRFLSEAIRSAHE